MLEKCWKECIQKVVERNAGKNAWEELVSWCCQEHW
jgi:hypothetical protein